MGVQFLVLLRISLIVLSGSLYASIVGFIIWGSFWMAGEENIYLGAIVGTFFFSVLTLSVAFLILAVSGQARNDTT